VRYYITSLFDAAEFSSGSVITGPVVKQEAKKGAQMPVIIRPVKT
jgi:hypothetical protein